MNEPLSEISSEAREASKPPTFRIKFNVMSAARKRTPDLAVKPRKLSGVRESYLMQVLAGNQEMIKPQFQSASQRARVPASPSSYGGVRA